MCDFLTLYSVALSIFVGLETSFGGTAVTIWEAASSNCRLHGSVDSEVDFLQYNTDISPQQPRTHICGKSRSQSCS